MKKLGMFALACAISSPVLAQTQSPFIQLIGKMYIGYLQQGIEQRAKRKEYDLKSYQTQCFVTKIQPEFQRRAEITAHLVFTPQEIQDFDKKFSPQMVSKIHQSSYLNLMPNTDFNADELLFLKNLVPREKSQEFQQAWANTFTSTDKILNDMLGLKETSKQGKWSKYEQLTEQRAKDCGFDISLL